MDNLFLSGFFLSLESKDKTFARYSSHISVTGSLDKSVPDCLSCNLLLYTYTNNPSFLRGCLCMGMNMVGCR